MLLALTLTFGGSALARPTPLPERPSEIPGPLVGSLEISNERERPVQVYIDGTFAIELPPSTTRVLPDVPNGMRLVSYGERGEGRERGARGEAGGYVTDRVDIRIDRRAAIRIAPLRGFISVRNTTGMNMRVSLGTLDLGLLAAGREVLSPAMPAGSYVLTAVPSARRLRPQTQDVVVRAGDTIAVELRPFTSSVVIDNPFPHPVNVFIVENGGKRVANIKRFESARLDDLDPGRVTLEMRQGGQRLAVGVIDLMPGAEQRWSPVAARVGQLEVINPSGSRVRVAIEGVDDFALNPGTSRVVTSVPEGPVNVRLTTAEGHTIVHEVIVVANRVERFEVPRAWLTRTPVRPHPF
jgi:hypothetical protein